MDTTKRYKAVFFDLGGTLRIALLEEPYINEATTLSGDIPFPVTVPPGCFFVLGDNRNHSQDSRSSALGFVPLDDIEGRAVFRFAPLSRFGPIEDRRP